MIIQLGPNPGPGRKRELDGPVKDWLRGLHEKGVAKMELYNQSKHSTSLRVTLVDGSSYRIQRTSSKPTNIDRPFTDTIEGATTPDFVSRPTIVIKFNFPLNLQVILLLCCSVDIDKRESKVENTCFVLTVMLNAVRYVLLGLGSSRAIPTVLESSPQEQILIPMDGLWKATYRQILEHEHEFWEESNSLPESTRSIIQDIIYEQAFEALQERGLRKEDMPIAYSAMARVAMLHSEDDCTEPPPQDVAWDKFWVDFTHSLNNRLSTFVQTPVSWMSTLALGELPINPRSLSSTRNSIKALPPVGQNARGLTSQMDARDLPHIYPLKDIQGGTTLFHFRSIGHGYSQLTARPSCSLGEFQPRDPSLTDCGCHVRASAWHVAASMAWDTAWPSALDQGKKAAKWVMDNYPFDESSTPQNPTSSRHHPAYNAVHDALRDASRWLKDGSNKPSHSNRPNTNKWHYPDLERYAQQRARKLLEQKDKVTHKDVFTTAYSAIVDKASEYANDAWKVADQTIAQQGGASNLAWLEWQKYKSGLILNRPPFMGYFAKRWENGFESHLKEAWLGSWKDAWLAAWLHAYNLAESKGIEIGVAAELASNLKNNKHSRHQIVAALAKTCFYQDIQARIKKQEPRNVLEYIRSLTKDLNHISNVYKHIVHNSHSDHFTIGVLVPNKDEDLLKASRISLRPPVLRELSYLELRKFIMREYFRKQSRETGTSFQRCVSLTWENYMRRFEKRK